MPASELNIRDYWRVIRQRKWIICLVFLVIFSSALIYSHFYQQPVYRATATVRITQQKGITIGIGSIERITISPGELMTTQLYMVTSSPALKKVVQELGLAGPDASDEEIHQVVSHLRKKVISAEVIGKTNAIRIKVDYPEPMTAAQIADSTVRAYIQLNLAEKSREAQTTMEFIGGRLTEIDKKLRASEDERRKFKETHQTTGRAISLYNQLVELEKERDLLLQKYDAQLTDLEEARELLLRKYYNDRLASLEKARDSLLSKYYDQLAKLTKQRDLLLRKYREKHPDVIDLNETIIALKEQISKYPEIEQDPKIVRLNQQIASLKEEITKYPEMEHDPEMVKLNQQIAALKEKMAKDPEMEQDPEMVKLNQKMTALKERLSQYPEEEIELSRLSRVVAINTSLYSDLKQKFTSAEIEAKQIPDVTVEEWAMVPKKPVTPDKPKVFIYTLIIALTLSLFSALIVEHLDRSIITIEQVENITNLPVLGVIPYFKGQAKRLRWWSWLFIPIRLKKSPLVELKEMKQRLLFWYPPTSSIGETYSILRANILAEGTEESPPPESPAGAEPTEPTISPYRALSERFRPEEEKPTPSPEPGPPAKENLMIIVTSSTHKEGKSITAANLALSLAQGGHMTLLVDADIRKPVVHKLFNLRREGGLNDILKGTGTLKDVISGRDLTARLEGAGETPYLDRLSILTVGRRERYPSELVRSPEFKALLEEVRKRYEVVVVDCPPILGVADMLVLGHYADAVLMVYRTGRTLRQLLVRAKQQLETSGIKVKGIVLNCIKPAYDAYYSYYHYYAYVEPKPEPEPEPEPEAEPKPEVKPKPEPEPEPEPKPKPAPAVIKKPPEAKPKFIPEKWRFDPEQKVWKHRHKSLFKKARYYVVDANGRCSECGKYISKYIPKYYHEKWKKKGEK